MERKDCPEKLEKRHWEMKKKKGERDRDCEIQGGMDKQAGREGCIIQEVHNAKMETFNKFICVSISQLAVVLGPVKQRYLKRDMTFKI
ncbi:hypothetical protein Hamer_G018792, partial [Homarus americanus]